MIYLHSKYESYQCNACNSQDKHAQQKHPVETKFNFESRKQKERKMALKAEITEDLNVLSQTGTL